VFRTVGDLQSRAEGEFRLTYYRKKRTGGQGNETHPISIDLVTPVVAE
jgi:hypothetical protein